MCIFSGEVESVSNTKIFARETEPGVQGLVYQMELSADEELAMILPLPVKLPVWDKAVKFINLEKYEDFFQDLNSAFPVPRAAKSLSSFSAGSLDLEKIEVVEVGSYEASFVPTLKDFDRLDKRFQVAPESWAKLPQYKDYGFAVFKLKPGSKTFHPMAFVFESRLAGQLFFPTVHIHDGQVHAEETFHHTLYAQGWLNGGIHDRGWVSSGAAIGEKVSEEKSQGLLWGEGKAYRRRMNGTFKNEDQILVGKPGK